MKNVILGTGLLVIGIAIGIAAITYKPLDAGLIKFKPQVTSIQPTPTIDETKAKKNSLAEFYNKVIQDEINKDYEKDYINHKPVLGNWITKEEYITYEKARMEKANILTSELIINNIQLEGNIGIINRTRIFCSTESCTGKDRTVDNGIRKFMMLDGKWSAIPDKQPTERALKAASYVVINSDTNYKNVIYNTFSYGVKEDNAAIHFIALLLDDDLQKLVTTETYNEKSKSEASRPIINYQAPDLIIQPPAAQQIPVNKSVNCTSNRIGNYTYTNCY